MPKSVKDLFFGLHEIKIKEIDGNLKVNQQQLTSLDGCPEIISGFFWCMSNGLRTLEDGPKVVEGNYSCYNCNLEVLHGLPKVIGGVLNIFNNKKLIENFGSGEELKKAINARCKVKHIRI